MVSAILLLVGTFFLAVQIDSFQTWLGNRATAYLSKQLRTTVHVEKVSIEFFNHVVLEKLYVQDLRHDTLFYAEQFSVTLNQLSFFNHILDVNEIALNHAKFRLTKYKGEQHDNLYFLLDYFASKDTTADTTGAWKIKFDNLKLTDVSFRHEVEDDTASPPGLDFEHLDATNINGTFSNIHFEGDSMFSFIHGLQFEDKSGFRLLELSTDAKVSSTQMHLNKLVLRTPETNLRADLIFDYTHFGDFDDFVTNVKWKSNFAKSTVSFNDLAYFSADLIGFNRKVKLEGDFSGTVNNLKGKKVTIEFGNHSYFKGKISIAGLPNLETAYFDVLADEFVTSKRDIETIPITPFDESNHVKLPGNLDALGIINCSGKFTGFYNDFIGYGNVNTAIGYISADMNMKYDKQKKKEFYSGHLSAANFNLGKILSSSMIGNISFNVDVRGSGLRLNNLIADVKGTVALIEYKKNQFKNILIDGDIANKLFAGRIKIDDENLALNFNGTVNLQEKIPTFDFSADILHMRLDTLNLFKMNTEAQLSVKTKINFTGSKLDEMQGSIEISDLNFQSNKNLYHLNKIFLTSYFKNNERDITIKSDNLDATLKGQFEFNGLANALKQILPRYLPSVILPVTSSASKQDFIFNIKLKNTALITEQFFPSWEVSANTIVNGRFKNIEHVLDFNLTSDHIRFKNFRFINSTVKITAGNNAMTAALQADSVYYSNSSYIIRPALNVVASENNIVFDFRAADSILYSHRAKINGVMNFLSADKFTLALKEAMLVVEKKTWTLNSQNLILFDTSSVVVNNFLMQKDKEEVTISGAVSKRETDKLNIGFKDFDMAHLNILLSENDVAIGGMLNGSASFENIYGNLLLSADLNVNNALLNKDTLGNLNLVSTYKNESKSLLINADIINGSQKILSINGNYFLNRGNENLDFDIAMNNFYLEHIERYVNNVISDVHGRASAKLKLTGSFKKPVFEGYVYLAKANCKVNYLNTIYNFSDTVMVRENNFYLNSFLLNDSWFNKAFVVGNVSHNYFKDFRFNLHLTTKKFLGLNTRAGMNDIYYGTAFVSGEAFFDGTIDNMNMKMVLNSERGSSLHFPLTTSSEVSKGEFIRFRNSDGLNNTKQYAHVITSGIILEMILSITPAADIEIIFDEKIGDIISGKGEGILHLNINTSGNFTMQGDYTIEKGDYLFTLQNIINKKFLIQRGGTISWTGDPFDATISMDAIYRGSNSTLYKLMGDSAYKKRLFFDVVLSLSNKLFNPSITYSINVEGLDASAQSQVRSILNSEAEVSKQVFGLLVLGQFLPSQSQTGNQTTETIDAGAGAYSSASELLSNQVSNWLGQLSKDVNVGFNYKARDTYTKDEMQILLSKSLFNERLTIEGDFGYVSDQTSRNFVGDITFDYALTENKRLSLKAYNKSNYSSISNYNYSPYTQGLGILYRREFNNFSELLSKKKKSKVEDAAPENSKPGNSPSSPSNH